MGSVESTFSLTNKVLETTQGLVERGDVAGFLGSRAVVCVGSAVASPIDALDHGARGVVRGLEAIGLVVVSPLVVISCIFSTGRLLASSCVGEFFRAVDSSLSNSLKALAHAVYAVVGPVLGFFSPTQALKLANKLGITDAVVKAEAKTEQRKAIYNTSLELDTYDDTLTQKEETRIRHEKVAQKIAKKAKTKHAVFEVKPNLLKEQITDAIETMKSKKAVFSGLVLPELRRKLLVKASTSDVKPTGKVETNANHINPTLETEASCTTQTELETRKTDSPIAAAIQKVVSVVGTAQEEPKVDPQPQQPAPAKTMVQRGWSLLTGAASTFTNFFNTEEDEDDGYGLMY